MELVRQHAQIRALAARVLGEATAQLGAMAAGETPCTAFHDSLIELRAVLTAHNAYEEAYLAPMLAVDAAMGPRRVSRMLEEHMAEHAAMVATLTGAELDVARRIPELVEELEAHLQAEERTFLSAAVLRDRQG